MFAGENEFQAFYDPQVAITGICLIKIITCSVKLCAAAETWSCSYGNKKRGNRQEPEGSEGALHVS